MGWSNRIYNLFNYLLTHSEPSARKTFDLCLLLALKHCLREKNTVLNHLLGPFTGLTSAWSAGWLYLSCEAIFTVSTPTYMHVAVQSY